MGDMADAAFDEMMAVWFDDPTPMPEPPADHQCHYCGKGGLQWFEFEGCWRLVSGDEDGECVVHTCPEYRAAKEE